jgi:hypothetical protein
MLENQIDEEKVQVRNEKKMKRKVRDKGKSDR